MADIVDHCYRVINAEADRPPTFALDRMSAEAILWRIPVAAGPDEDAPDRVQLVLAKEAMDRRPHPADA